MNPAEIRLKGAPNFRDLGGYPAADGRKVRCGRVFRSGGLSKLTSDDVDVLSRLGLKLVCDLRSEHERNREPAAWSEKFKPRTLHFNVNADVRAGNADLLGLLRQDPSERGAMAMMMDVYASVPGMLKDHVGTFFSALLDEKQVPLVLHCTAGKDRAGVLSAITLLTLGVPREAVYEDYMKTALYQDLPKLEAQVTPYLAPAFAPNQPPQEVLSILTGVRRDFLDAALGAMGEDNGRIDDYLRSAGITRPQIEQLRRTLLE